MSADIASGWTGWGEAAVRLLAFLLVFALLAVVEWQRPRRTLRVAKARRWVTNLSIVAINTVMLRVLSVLAVPVAAVSAALAAEAHGWGLLPALQMPSVVNIVVSLIVLDFAIWLQHVVSHKVPVLWRLHQMHHADRDVDVTTAIRFHPVEIALSMLWKIVVVVALGAPAASVVIFEVLLNAFAMFSHANIQLSAGVDGFLRRVIVTPDMHRVHHSVYRAEHDTNYGFNLSVWDRWFGTYTAEPADGHDAMRLGLQPYQSDGPSQLAWSLALPLSQGRNTADGADPPDTKPPQR